MSGAGGLRTLSLTAARTGFSPPPQVVTDRLAALPEFSRYVTGAAHGGDSWLGRWLCARQVAAKHVVIVPADRSQVDPLTPRQPKVYAPRYGNRGSQQTSRTQGNSH